MQTTTNFGLKKPTGSDPINIEDLNYNVDTLDIAMQNAQTAATNAVKTATDANTAATAAQTASTEAKTTAESATTAASEAKATADQATKTATEAKTTAQNAQTAATNAVKTKSVTLSHTAWNSSTKQLTASVPDVTTGNSLIIGLAGNATDDQAKAASSAGVRGISQAANSITFKCNSIPTVDIPLSILIIG